MKQPQYMKQVQYSLDKDQLQDAGLLSIGTFLEYFDLMLYVHMAVLLNELFFPKTDPHTAMLLSAFSFCTTFIFRPLGALLFGWIGDNIGRKQAIVLTTFIMSFSCVVMANLPTYSQVGITASCLITLCRVLQGISSSGEIAGAELYLTEITYPPIQYPVVSFISVISSLGTFTALAVASLFTSYSFNWRLAFWFGCVIAVIGSFARSTLRETKDFSDAKLRINKIFDEFEADKSALKTDPIVNEKVALKTSIFYFMISCSWPICMYFSYIHCGGILKNLFNFTPAQIIHQNLILSIVQVVIGAFLSLLGYKIYPLKILKIQSILFLIFVLFCPFLLEVATNSWIIFLVQCGLVLFSIGRSPATAIFYKNFPVFKRFTYTSMLYALSRTIMYVVSSFGLVYLTKYFSHYGILVLLIPVIIISFFGYLYFEKLEEERQRIFNYKKL